MKNPDEEEGNDDTMMGIGESGKAHGDKDGRFDQ